MEFFRLRIPFETERIGASCFSIFKSAGGGVETPESELSPESEPPLSLFSGVTVPSDGGFDPSQNPLSPFESPPESVESFSTLSSFLRSSERSNFDRSDFFRSRRFLRASRSWNSGCGWSAAGFRRLDRRGWALKLGGARGWSICCCCC